MSRPAPGPQRRRLSRPACLAIWVLVGGAGLVPVALAAVNPLQLTRDLSYVVAGLSGAAALAILLIQPLLAAGYLPGLTLARARRWHRRTGAALVLAVALHVGGLYLTSPPDTLDALLLVAPVPFSIYGVAAMWALILTALLVWARTRLPLSATAWRVVHNVLALIIVITTCAHALLIEGTMGTMSKALLCLAALAATVAVIVDLRLIRPSSLGRP